MSAVQVRFSAEASRELEASTRWYEERASGLGSELLREVDRAIDAIRRAPERWPVCPHDARAKWFVLSRFPFALVYLARSEAEVVVVAVAHTKRRPGYWRA